MLVFIYGCDVMRVPLGNASAAVVAMNHVFRMNLDVYALIAQRIAAADHLVDDLVFREAMGPAALARMVETNIQGLANLAFQLLREVDRSRPWPLSVRFRARAALRSRHSDTTTSESEWSAFSAHPARQ